MDEVALTESRTLRAQYADRTDVLDKVKALALLPNGVHASVEQTATYYEVHPDAVEKVIRTNRDELDEDGMDVLSGSRLSAFKAESGYRSRAASLTLLPRRAILRVGMLLRDSEVARQVRTYLLDAEAAPVTGREMTRLELIDLAREAELDRIKETARADQAEQRAGVAEGKMREIEGADGLTIRAFHKKYFSDVPEREFFEHLYAKGYLIDQRGKGSIRPDGSVRDGSQHRHPSFKGKAYLYLHFGGIHGDRRREYTRVRPGQPELEFKAALVRQGLKPNDGDDGYLFGLPDGA